MRNGGKAKHDAWICGRSGDGQSRRSPFTFGTHHACVRTHLMPLHIYANHRDRLVFEAILFNELQKISLQSKKQGSSSERKLVLGNLYWLPSQRLLAQHIDEQRTLNTYGAESGASPSNARRTAAPLCRSGPRRDRSRRRDRASDRPGGGGQFSYLLLPSW